MSKPIRGQGGRLNFPIGPKSTNMVEDSEILLPVRFRWIPFSGFRGEVENVSANKRPGRPSCFSNRPKNTKLVDDIKISLPVKFRWILFSGFRGEVENVSANQRPGRPSCFSDQPKKHKFRSAVSEEKSKMSRPIRGQGGHLVFPIGPKKHKLGRGRCDLASCQDSFNSN